MTFKHKNHRAATPREHRAGLAICGMITAVMLLGGCAATGDADKAEFEQFRKLTLSPAQKQILARHNNGLKLNEPIQMVSNTRFTSKSLVLKSHDSTSGTMISQTADGALLVEDVYTGDGKQSAKAVSRKLSLCGFTRLTEVIDRSALIGNSTPGAHQRLTTETINATSGQICTPEPGGKFALQNKVKIENARYGQYFPGKDEDRITTRTASITCTVSEPRSANEKTIRGYQGQVYDVQCLSGQDTPDASTRHLLYLVDLGLYVQTWFDFRGGTIEASHEICAPGTKAISGACI